MKNPKIGERVRIKETNIKGIIIEVDQQKRWEDLNYYNMRNVLINYSSRNLWIPQEMLIRLIPKKLIKPTAPGFVYINLYSDGLFGNAYCDFVDLSRYQGVERENVISNPLSSRLVYKLVEEIPV